MNAVPLKTMTVPQLLSLYADVLDALRTRGVTHSTNNPVANYSEYLAARALSLTPMVESTKGYDAIDATGTKYEIKGRRPTAKNRSRQLSYIRGLPDKSFDALIGILYNEDMTVAKACVIPHAVVLQKAVYNKHANAWVFHLRDDIWSVPDVRDITAAITQAAATQQQTPPDRNAARSHEPPHRAKTRKSKAMTQRDFMRHLYAECGDSPKELVRRYATAERQRIVARSSNTFALSPEQYALALYSDGKRKGWIGEGSPPLH